MLLVLIVELLNTGIEAAIDRIGPEWHDLSKRAKDMGSAAVLLALLLARASGPQPSRKGGPHEHPAVLALRVLRLAPRRRAGLRRRRPATSATGSAGAAGSWSTAAATPG